MADLHGGAIAKITIKVKDWDASAGPPYGMAYARITCKVDGFQNPNFMSCSPFQGVTSDGQTLTFTLPVPNPWANPWDHNTRDDIPAFQGNLVVTFVNVAGIGKFNAGSAGGGIACCTDCYYHGDGSQAEAPGQVTQQVNIKKPGT